MFRKIKNNIRNISKCILDKIIKDDLLNKKIVVTFYNLKNIKIGRSKEIYNIFDYHKILEDKKHKCKELYRGNSFYGIGNALREYSIYRKPIRACIEHGVYFGDYVDPKETYKTRLPAVITFSKNREKHIKKYTTKPVFCIGPYINYVDGILNEDDMSGIKQELGKTLLVFPTHSIDRVESKFNIQELIDYVEFIKTKHKFDTVIVCLYWKDIELNKDIPYLDQGYRVVTAGNRNDSNFLKRLKTFIQLSDYTISNSVGTHVGYCIALNKPHHIFGQEIRHIGDSINDVKSESIDTNKLTREKEMNEVLNEFCNYSEHITNNQIKICNKFWGLDQIKNSNEIRTLLEFCEFN